MFRIQLPLLFMLVTWLGNSERWTFSPLPRHSVTRWKKGDTLPVVFISEDCLDVVYCQLRACDNLLRGIFCLQTWHLKTWKFRMIFNMKAAKDLDEFYCHHSSPKLFSTISSNKKHLRFFVEHHSFHVLVSLYNFWDGQAGYGGTIQQQVFTSIGFRTDDTKSIWC